ncbi:MAG: disulfide oxidoreductase, partial [Elstera sp.]
VRAHLATSLGPIQALRDAELTGAARGLAFELAEAGGSLARAAVTIAVEKLTKADRSALGKLGVRLGTETIYLDAVLKPQAITLKALLHAIAHGQHPPLPAPAGPAVPRDPDRSNEWYERLGFVVLGPRVVRADLVERLAQAVREKAAHGPFAADASLARLAYCKADDVPAVLAALGYRGRPDPATAAEGAGDAASDLRFTRRRRRPQRAPERPTPGVFHPDSPFAKLREMVLIP